MENVLQKANKHTISLPLAEIKRNNKLLKEVKIGNGTLSIGFDF